VDAAIDAGRVEEMDAQVKGAVDGPDGRVDLVLPVRVILLIGRGTSDKTAST
jgi:hypothetical protein